jgi:hypothetical protein
VIRPLLCLIALGLASCGGSAPPPPVATPPPPVPPARSEPPPPKLASGTLSRKDVTSFVDAGFPHLLQMVAVEPALEGGKFKGWTIVSLSPPEFWKRVDLEVEKISVSFQRKGTLRTLDYRVVDEPSASQAPPPAK